MAHVDVPKDLNGISTKLALGLTKKQIIGFVVAAVIGVPVYLTTRISVGNDIGMLLMIGAMALPILYAIYEPKGMTIEQYLGAWLRFQFVAKGVRPYQTETLRAGILNIREEEMNGASTGKNPLRKR